MSANRKGKATGLTPWMKGRTQPAEAKAAQHTKMKGRFVGDLNPFKGKTHTNEVKAAIALNTSRAQKGRAKPKSLCSICGKMCAAHVMSRHICIIPSSSA
jgi:hypothetical protein